MQIHELNKRNVLEQRPPKPAPVTGLDTSKVSPYIAAQIKKAEADSQANLTQQAQAPAQPALYNRPVLKNLQINVKPGGSKEAQAFQVQRAAQQAAQQASTTGCTKAADSVVGKPSLADRAKGFSSRQAGINQRYDSGQYKWDQLTYAYGDRLGLPHAK